VEEWEVLVLEEERGASCGLNLVSKGSARK
jgi:hypothetical protein